MKYFRNKKGNVKSILNNVEGIEFKKNPIDFFITLARYKFAARLLKTNDIVADVGCGTGLGSIFLSKFCKKVVGLDYDHQLIQFNSKNHSDINNISFDRFDLTKKIPKRFEKNFDVCVSMDVIEHFEYKDILKFVIPNYKRLIKKKGFCIIGTPNINSQKYASERRLSTHPYEFNYQNLKISLEKKFNNVHIFSMNDEIVSTQFSELAWYYIAVCS